MRMDEPLVSISVTAYQHAAYLAACLDGILAQEVHFPYEILLGEDGSTDGTRELAVAYAKAHPDRIKLFLHDRRNVVHIDGRATGRSNFLNNVRHARGRYLCHIDGDDRWTDPLRLDIMVARMEQETDLAMCFHNAVNVYPNGRRIDYVRAWLKGRPLQERYVMADLVTGNFIPTSGVMWRFDPPMSTFPPEWSTASMGDWVFNLHFARKGPIGFIDRIMSERRVHDGGVIAAADPLRKIAVNLRMLGIIDQMTAGSFTDRIEQRRMELHVEGMRYALERGRKDEARSHWGALRSTKAYRPSLRTRLRDAMLVWTPGLAKLFHQLRS